MNFRVTVNGEVARPGTYEIKRGQFTPEDVNFCILILEHLKLVDFDKERALAQICFNLFFYIIH
ncbi:MAG: hypothetical protein LBK58_00880 [Prevotellaceae bacterium]|jgi:hypothetical protein|nr:hypothetical protein [Prevotellaceae bacterium]